MVENTIQKIESSPISLVAKRVDSLVFDSGSPLDGQNMVKGHFNITNSITQRTEDKDGNPILEASLNLTITPEDGYGYYSLNISVSGTFSKVSDDLSDDKFEKAVLSDGVTELYSFAKTITGHIVRGGVFGDIAFPILRYSF